MKLYVLSEYAIITVVLHLHLPTKNLNIGQLIPKFEVLCTGMLEVLTELIK